MTTLTFSSESEIHRIGLGVIDLTLPKAEWTHAAHFAAALWLMRYRPDIDAAARMPGMIRAYNEATGVANTDTEGYHETITQASLRAARDWLDGNDPQTPVFVLVNALMTSPLGRSDWLLAHWSRPRLFSVTARRQWVDPDLDPLPYPRGRIG